IDSEVSADGINLLVLEGYSTFVNKQQFLCLRGRKKDYNHSDKEVGESHFYIINYETPSRDELIIKHFSTQKAEELIKEGKLKGEVVKEDMSKGQPVDKVSVTSSSDELIEAISREGVGAFIWQDPNDVLRDIYILVFSRIKP
ncbi:MAG: hypothetical protein ACYST5_07820, partial [Planctomycetota bacterium]